jgi:long-chain acyl-CoA synthetase
MPILVDSDDKKTFVSIIKSRLKETPSTSIATYMEGGERKRISFQDFYNQSMNITAGLLQNGSEKGDRVIVLSKTRIEWAFCDIAIMCAGGVTVPIYPTNVKDDASYIVEHSGSKIAIIEDSTQWEKIKHLVENGTLDKVIQFDGPLEAHEKLVSFEDFTRAGKEYLSGNPDAVEKVMDSIKPEDLASITYTSGTTGRPKGVMINHMMLYQTMSDAVDTLGKYFEVGDQTLTFLPLSHVMGKFESLTPWAIGWTTNYALSLDTLLKDIADVKPTIMIAVPRIFEKVYTKITDQIENSPPIKQKLFKWAMDTGREYWGSFERGKAPGILTTIQYELAFKIVLSKVYNRFGGRIRYFISGGAPLNPELNEFLRICKLPVLEGYGLTETCAPCSVNLPEANTIGTVGKLFPSCELKIATDGEICLKGPTIFTGYYKNEEATKECIVDGWFHTGDLGDLTEDGYLKITGRKKDLIITAGGKNIAPQNIENSAKALPFISQFMVHGDQKKYLTALVTMDQEAVEKWAEKNGKDVSNWEDFASSDDAHNLIQKSVDELNSKLAKYETIKKFTIVPTEFTEETGELTASMKVKRKFCMEKYNSLLENMY